MTQHQNRLRQGPHECHLRGASRGERRIGSNHGRDNAEQSESTRGWHGRPWIAKAAIALAAWSAIGVIFAIPGIAAGEWRPLLGSLAQWWAWGLLALVIVACDRRLPIPVQRIGLRLIAHIPLSLIVTAASL